MTETHAISTGVEFYIRFGDVVNFPHSNNGSISEVLQIFLIKKINFLFDRG